MATTDELDLSWTAIIQGQVQDEQKMSQDSLSQTFLGLTAARRCMTLRLKKVGT